LPVVQAFPDRPAVGTACLLELRGEGIREPEATVLPAGPGSAEVGPPGAARGIVFVQAGPDRFVGLLGIDLEDPAGRWQVQLRWKQAPALAEQRKPFELEVLPRSYPVQTLKLPPSKVDLSAEDLARVEREAAAVKAALGLRTPVERLGPWVHPLRSAPAGDRFGSRRVINGEPKAQHSGADYEASAGTPVRSMARGTVVLTGEHFFAGRSVYVDHGGGLITMYFHLERIGVREGQRLEAGEVLGAVGATGRVTGPHLHFGVRLGGARVEPDSLLALARFLAGPSGRKAKPAGKTGRDGGIGVGR
jgi:murein DD-endopeptidase MepM/ murein hydrolase activator NlpD